MPTYQYRCTACGQDLEAVQKFSDATLTECPSCGGPLRKVFNAVGVVFKGSGFYRTDSRKGTGDGNGSGTSDKDKSERKDSGDKDKGERKDSGDKKKADTKEPAAAKATNGSGGTKQPAASGSPSTGGSGPA